MNKSARRWIEPTVLFAAHDRQIAEHGGSEGIRDRSVIESALARPQNLTAHGTPDAAEPAAAYAYGLARNHGFVDGNKRIAWISARLFLADNGYSLTFEPLDAIRIMQNLAAGRISESELAGWFRQRIEPREKA